MIFVVVFSALAVSMAALSGANAQIADNQCKLDHARAAAESGFDVIRYWLSKVSISGTTSESQRLTQIAGDVSIVNPIANVDLQGGQAGIGSETG